MDSRIFSMASFFAAFFPRLSLVALSWLLLCLGILCSKPLPVQAADYQVKAVKQMTQDSNGLALRFPSVLFFDNATDETYLVTGGRAQVALFADDFFPLMTMGPGREIYTPQGGGVDHEGQVYLCQSPKEGRPARITVLNGAFIVVREILLDDIPGAANFVPRRLAISSTGLIYVASQHRGVLVLDADGTFLRWLQPVDRLSKRALAAVAETAEEDSNSDPSEPEAGKADIPEEYRPAGEGDPAIGPVLTRAVTIDSTGNIYLVSSETGKVYVYSAEEIFLFSFGSKGGTPGKLSQPRNVAVDRENNLMYVVDYMRHTILAYNEKGEYLFEFGGRGASPGWFNFPSDVILNRRGQLLVADLFNHRVQVLEVKNWSETPVVKHLLITPPVPPLSAEDNAVKAAPAPSDPGIKEEVVPEQEIPTYPDEVKN